MPRYFRYDADAGRWRQLHHHGSIDDAERSSTCRHGTASAGQDRQVIPVHHDTFPPIETDAEAFKAIVESATRGELVLLRPGETHMIGRSVEPMAAR